MASANARIDVPNRWSGDRWLLFANGTVGSHDVAGIFRDADIVIAMDWNANWAARPLAKRIPEPQVVRGVVGALRKVSGPDHTR